MLDLNKRFRLWPAWYCGDFHAHTNHSDGSLTPPQLVAEARAKQLDFFCITDHNVTTAYDQFGDHDDMLIIPGTEVTMKYGHFNVFGIVDREQEWLSSLPIDRESYTHHMQTGEAVYTPNQLMALTKAAGLYNSINHPLLGVWKWFDGDTDLRNVDFIEIWNDPTWPENAIENPAAVAVWTQMLNAGHRLTAIGGSDFHHAHTKMQSDGTLLARDHLNRPTTYVYADMLSGAAILQGLVKRRAYMTMGPLIAFALLLDGQTFMIGDDLGRCAGTATVRATVQAEQADDAITVQLVQNGVVIGAARGTGEVGFEVQVVLTADDPQWLRIDVRNGRDELIAVTNPIFSGPEIVPTENRFGDFVDLA